MTKPELKQVTEIDYLDWVKNLDLTFAFDYNPDEDSLRDLLEFERTFGHRDDERFVSTISTFPLRMAVPGSVVRCGGTTVVTVAPTHRRQGLLNEMMHRHLADVRDHDEPIAALWASESEIYGRFGYGVASISATLAISHPYPRIAPNVADHGDVRLIEVDEARKLIPLFHETFASAQPGMFSRWDAWWESRIFNDLPKRRNGFTANRWVVVDGSNGIEGYARYRAKGGFGGDGHGDGEIMVHELFANTPRAWVGLWRYLLHQDLMTTFTARLRSPHDPIFDILDGPRRARPTISDGVWVRVMDVTAALEARSYSSAFGGTIEVHDPMGIAGGTYSVNVSPDGAEVKRSNAKPDLSLDIRDLGSIYLGRPGLVRMSRVGRVQGNVDLLKQADQAFSWYRQPWCPEIF